MVLRVCVTLLRSLMLDTMFRFGASLSKQTVEKLDMVQKSMTRMIHFLKSRLTVSKGAVSGFWK